MELNSSAITDEDKKTHLYGKLLVKFRLNIPDWN
jgi:hypothetical protein